MLKETDDKGSGDPTKLDDVSYIGALPVEILSIIFQVLFRSSNSILTRMIRRHLEHEEQSIWDCHCLSSWDEQEDVRSDALFPYAPASTCIYWRDILAREPQYWTRIVAFVDGERPTSVHDFKDCLLRSRPRNIQVYILRRAGTYESADPAESARSKALIKALAPHSLRCKKLVFDVVHRSSLPSLLRDLRWLPTSMDALRLECRRYEEIFGRGDTKKMADISFDWQRCLVRDFIRDGYNFIETHQHFRNPFGYVNSFTISRFTPFLPAHLRFTVRDALDAFVSIIDLYNLRSLTLHDVNFVDPLADAIPNPAAGLGTELPGFASIALLIPGLRLVDLRGAFVSSLFRHGLISGETLEIVNCSLEPHPHRFFFLQLSLIGIRCPDLSPVFKGFMGQVLRLVDCAGLTDDALQILAVRPEGTNFYFTSFSTLIIEDCPNITISGLKRMIEGRKSVLTGYRMDIRGLRVLEVKKSSSIELTPADVEWFTANVDEFQYL